MQNQRQKTFEQISQEEQRLAENTSKSDAMVSKSKGEASRRKRRNLENGKFVVSKSIIHTKKSREG